MPWKDLESKHEYDRQYNKTQCKLFTIKVKNDTGIPYAMERMSQSIGTSNNAYIVEALAEKLRRDGYLQD